MGLFSTTSPFDSDVDKATNENNTSEDWGLIMEICDKVGSSTANSKDCLRSIIRRLNNPDPHVALQAITLLDACVNNCGRTFQLEIASRDFESELKKLLHKSQPRVAEKLRQLIKKWAEGDFKNSPELSLIPAMYVKLRMEGMDFSSPSSDPTTKSSRVANADPDSVSSQEEVDAIAKAIELSLKETHSPKQTSVTNLYPSVSGFQSSSSAQSSAPEQRKVRALYDFEAAEDNELTFFAGEIIFIIDDSDANWWKGSNQRGEGLFPANFVTSDLNIEPEKTRQEKKVVQFNESVEVKTIRAPQQVEINENKIDRLLHLLHEADPNDGQKDTEEMLVLEEEVNAMGPLIDSELERVDRKHAQLTQLSSGLVEALNLYHTLMREPPTVKPPPSQMFSHPPMFNGPAPHMPPGMYVIPPDNFLARLPPGPPGGYSLPPQIPRPEDMQRNPPPGVPFNGIYGTLPPPGVQQPGAPPQPLQHPPGAPQPDQVPHFPPNFIPPQPYPTQPPHNHHL